MAEWLYTPRNIFLNIPFDGCTQFLSSIARGGIMCIICWKLKSLYCEVESTASQKQRARVFLDNCSWCIVFRGKLTPIWKSRETSLVLCCGSWLAVPTFTILGGMKGQTIHGNGDIVTKFNNIPSTTCVFEISATLITFQQLRISWFLWTIFCFKYSQNYDEFLS